MSNTVLLRAGLALNILPRSGAPNVKRAANEAYWPGIFESSLPGPIGSRWVSRRISQPVIAIFLFIFASAWNAHANIPGGGTGTGANVTMTTQTRSGVPYTITLDNGIVNAVINIATAQLTYLTYNGVQFTDGYYASDNGCFYWQGNVSSSQTLLVVKDPAANGGNIAEISLEDSAANSGNNANAHRHFTMLRGSPGVYVTEIFTRDASLPAGGVDMVSFTGRLTSSPVLNWLAQDGADPRNLLMPVDATGSLGGISDSPKEVSLTTSGNLAGTFDCKYNYAGDLGLLTITGWCSTAGTAGIWILHPSNEYLSCGPTHRGKTARR